MTESPLPSAWTIRPYQHGDEYALCELFARAFGKSITVAQWRWKHHARPSPAPNVWLAEMDGKAIFHTSGIPLCYKLNAREQIAMVSVDTMTDPDFRRRGLLTAVAARAYDAYRAAQIPFVIGILNEKWGSRADALGWTPLFPLVWQVRPFLPSAILARRVRIPWLERATLLNALWNRVWNLRLRADATIRVREIKHAGAEFDTLWQNAAGDYMFSIVRNRAWVEWRYFREPTGMYRVLFAQSDATPRGYLAYRVVETQGRRAGVITEIFTRRGDTLAVHALLADVLRAWQTENVQLAMHCALRGTWLADTLQRAGFVFRPGAFNVQIIPLDMQLSLADLREPNRWFMAGGDFDDV